MPYWRLHYHFVWATNSREPLIEDSLRPALYGAIAAKSTELGAIVHAVGGTVDHVHLAVSVPPSVALSRFVGQVKGSSSHLTNHEFRPALHFSWQSEYGVTSFGGGRTWAGWCAMSGISASTTRKARHPRSSKTPGT